MLLLLPILFLVDPPFSLKLNILNAILSFYLLGFLGGLFVVCLLLLFLLYFFVCFLSVKIGSHYVVQAVLELSM